MVGGAGPSPALALGNAVHAALEWSARAGWERSGDRTAFRRCSRARVSRTTKCWPARRGWWTAGLALSSARRFAMRGCGPRRRSCCRSVGPCFAATSTSSRPRTTAAITGVARSWSISRPTGSGPAESRPLGERYASQRAVYALAVAGRPPVAGLCGPRMCSSSDPTSRWSRSSTRPRSPQRARASRGSWPRSAPGSFEVTDEPYAALCFGCPAAPRLCPRPAWRPSRDAPAPGPMRGSRCSGMARL